jgi:hypothetical protein
MNAVLPIFISDWRVCSDVFIRMQIPNDCRDVLKNTAMKSLPIATGVIEAAYGYLVNDRMNVTGAR